MVGFLFLSFLSGCDEKSVNIQIEIILVYSNICIHCFIKSFVNNDAAVPGLNRNSAYLKKSFLPSREIQNQFDCLIDKYFKQSENLESQNQLLREARDILLPRLMTGMIDVEKMNLKTPQPATA